MKKELYLYHFNFGFVEIMVLALPLIALQYHTVKLIIEFNSFETCWRKEFSTYYLTKSGNKVTINTSKNEKVSTIFSDLGNLRWFRLLL